MFAGPHPNNLSTLKLYILNEAHILLTPNKDHQKVFGDKPLLIG